MSLIQLPQHSEAWEVALWHDLLPALSLAMDEANPGFTNRMYDVLSEDEIQHAFEDCCTRAGYEIAIDAHENPRLIKTPLAQQASNKGVAFSQKLLDNQNVTPEDLHRVINGRSRFNDLLISAAKSLGGQEITDKRIEEKAQPAHWKFPDKSCMRPLHDSIETWNITPVTNENDYVAFIKVFKRALEHAMQPCQASDTAPQ